MTSLDQELASATVEVAKLELELGKPGPVAPSLIQRLNAARISLELLRYGIRS